jgi:predicted acyltransferase
MTTTQRFLSLDVFRGLTVAGMILVNNPGSWAYVYTPLEHAHWHGCTPTDLVFPFFLFAVGNAMSFAMKKYEGQGHSAVIRKILKRTLLIFLIGLLLNWFPFFKWNEEGQLVFKSLSQLRILGVLPRIALCYGLAGLIIHFLGERRAFVIAGCLLLVYWWLVLAFGQGDPYSLEGYAGLRLDKWLLGAPHLYKGEGVPFDPEGILSTLPATCNVIFGYLAGSYIQQKGKDYPMLCGLLITGCLLLFAALCWNMVFPINKKIWTSSYVLYTVGIALLLLSVLIYAIEFRGWKQPASFFEVFGKNPLFIYVMSGVLVKLYLLVRTGPHQNLYGWLYENVFRPIGGNYPGSLLFALFHVCLFWLLGWWMDRKKIYIRV